MLNLIPRQIMVEPASQGPREPAASLIHLFHIHFFINSFSQIFPYDSLLIIIIICLVTLSPRRKLRNVIQTQECVPCHEYDKPSRC